MKMVSHVMKPNLRNRTNRGIGRSLFIGLVFVFLLAPIASRANEAEPQDTKAFWQNKYQGLIARAAELRGTIRTEQELYADANRRNYRRGPKRHIHQQAVKEATLELTKVEAELKTIKEDGRRAGALPGWFNEVEMEIEDTRRRPAISAGPGIEGRNPLHLEDS
jgi:hypothetical protein